MHIDIHNDIQHRRQPGVHCPLQGRQNLRRLGDPLTVAPKGLRQFIVAGIGEVDSNVAGVLDQPLTALDHSPGLIIGYDYNNGCIFPTSSFHLHSV